MIKIRLRITSSRRIDVVNDMGLGCKSEICAWKSHIRTARKVMRNLINVFLGVSVSYYGDNSRRATHRMMILCNNFYSKQIANDT